MATESLQGPKPAITLGSANPGLLRRAKDLVWFLRFWFGSVPGAARLWIGGLIVIGLLSTAQLWLARAVIDSVQTDPARITWLYLTLTIVVISAERILGNRVPIPGEIIRERAIPFVQAKVLQQSAEISLEAYESQEFYDTASRLAKDFQVKAESGALNAISVILSTLPALIGNIILLWSIDWRAALLMPLPSIPMMAVSFIFGNRLWGFIREQTRDIRIAGYLAEQLTNRQPAKEIRLFGLQDFLIARWSQHYLATRRSLRIKRFQNQLRGQIISNSVFILPFAVLFWLVFESGATFSSGDILILVTLQMIVGSAFGGLAQSVHGLAEFAGLASDVRALTSVPLVFSPESSANTHPGVSKGEITFEHVSFRYPGSSARVLDDVSFVIEPGQHVAIVGENGAGKTTLIKLALGLYEPDEGRILLDGMPLQEIPVADRQTLFSAVFQQFTRYPLTVEENLILNRKDLATNVEAALQNVHMRDTIAQLPRNRKTVLSPDLGGVDLSGGQWQRLAIARAGLRDATVLALDEPTAALDPIAEVTIFQRFNQISQGRTTLLVSHRLGMARLAERILVIELGRLVEDGSHTQLLADQGIYANLWRIQSRWYL